MSIWQNFKETDHWFEKRFFAAILITASVIGLLFAIDKLLDRIPEATRLLNSNSGLLLRFLIALVALIFITALVYTRTLDTFEGATKATIKASIFNAIAWSLFWLCWSIFCAWLAFTTNPLTLPVKVILLTMVVTPGVLAFLFSRSIRKQELKDEMEDQQFMGNNYDPSAPGIICLEKKYCCGYYGLICLPVYLIALLIGTLF